MKLTVYHRTLSKHPPVSIFSSIFCPSLSLSITVCFTLPSSVKAFVSYIIMSLVFDGFVFAATSIYSFMASKSCRPMHLLQAVRRDGILYFLVVFSSQLAWVLCLQYGRVSSSLPTYPCLLTIQSLAFDQTAAWAVSLFQYVGLTVTYFSLGGPTSCT
jgi:hypothetical protein